MDEELDSQPTADDLDEGLRQLGLRRDSDSSVLHLWARQLPGGMFDGHRSAMVAPDHLLFHGLTARLVSGTFRLLTRTQRTRVGLSLREALARSHFPTTTIYNERRNRIVSVGISEWAATLPLFGFVTRRTLRSASRRPPSSASMTPLQRALKIVDSFAALVCAAYFFPRAELDGLSACRARITPRDLQVRAEVFFDLVQEACLRVDLKAFGMHLDVPNLHRLRELVDHVIPALLHVRHAQELLFENAHQPLKRGVVTGNGQADATRALTRYRQAELAARLRLDPNVFSLPQHWAQHAGVRACLAQARPLWSEGGGAWRCCGGKLPESRIMPAAQHIAKKHAAAGAVIGWFARATRGGGAGLQVGDAVAVPVAVAAGLQSVNVARDQEPEREEAMPAFFRTVVFFTTPAGTASAVVQPLVLSADGGHWSLDAASFLFLPLTQVRRALILHDCECLCTMSSGVLAHKASNRWAVLGRHSGYPPRGG